MVTSLTGILAKALKGAAPSSANAGLERTTVANNVSRKYDRAMAASNECSTFNY
jgi:hypothetical protein